jgi:hypothetical protein
MQDLMERGVGRCGGGDALKLPLDLFQFQKMDAFFFSFFFLFSNFITWKKPWVAIQCHHVCTKCMEPGESNLCAPLLHITSGIIKENPIILDFETKSHQVLEWLYAYIPEWYQHFKNLPQT